MTCRSALSRKLVFPPCGLFCQHLVRGMAKYVKSMFLLCEQNFRGILAYFVGNLGSAL
jgi:hypothetical protein